MPDFKEKDLLALTKKIRDDDLKKKVEAVIKDLKPAHSSFKIAQSIEKTPAAPTTRLVKEGGLVQHTIGVTEIAEAFASIIKRVYSVDVNIDHVVAAAILHDLYKTVEFGAVEGTYVTAEFHLNHLNLMVAELYRRNFPKEIIHAIAAHFGENSPTPPLTYEALCLYYADTYASVIETNVSRAEELEKQIALVLKPAKITPAEAKKEKEEKTED